MELAAAAHSSRMKVVAWVGREVLPHEGDLRAWLAGRAVPGDVDDIVQEAYARIAALDDVGHIRSGRAYFFTAAKMVLLEQLRRANVVRIDTVADIHSLDALCDERSPERIAAARSELDLVQSLIRGLPARCRRIFEMRKIEGLPQREIARIMGVPEHTVENDVAKGLRLILAALERREGTSGTPHSARVRDERRRDRKGG